MVLNEYGEGCCGGGKGGRVGKTGDSSSVRRFLAEDGWTGLLSSSSESHRSMNTGFPAAGEGLATAGAGRRGAVTAVKNGI